MYKGKRLKRNKHRLGGLGVFALVLLLSLSVSGTLGFLVASDGPIANFFSATEATIDIVEEFSANQKSSIQIKNTGDVSVFIRVSLVSSTTDSEGNLIADTNANLSGISLGAGWIKIGNYYYYTSEVIPEQLTNNLLNNPISLNEDQTITVLAQCIQSQPISAVEEAWHVSVVNGKLAQNSTMQEG